MIPRLTTALAFALFASGLLLAAPGKPPWVFYLATATSLGSLGAALFLTGRALRELERFRPRRRRPDRWRPTKA